MIIGLNTWQAGCWLLGLARCAENHNPYPMKTPALLIVVLCWWLASLNQAAAQQTLTVSPAVTSNTYPGFITLKITGLTNTEQVIIRRWLDFNGNGVVDPGEPLIEAFRIRDGGAMVIGGVTNVSAPYDSDSNTGEIV